ncbi:unnamed protein product [Nesidiocoris tenuis]|uniref:Uncharacterized protein n=1 Tax=Nesidiocoris tenuis TaxID=355587 RepID=A0A6H5HRI8_9HEMI|nr:unnamed protein product [Nesidiocoris tenuis]
MSLTSILIMTSSFCFIVSLTSISIMTSSFCFIRIGRVANFGRFHKISRLVLADSAKIPSHCLHLSRKDVQLGQQRTLIGCSSVNCPLNAPVSSSKFPSNGSGWICSNAIPINPFFMSSADIINKLSGFISIKVNSTGKVSAGCGFGGGKDVPEVLGILSRELATNLSHLVGPGLG